MPFYYDLNKSHDNAWLRAVRRIYRPLGFQKGYNFPLWVIFGGAMFAFGLARLEYLDIDGIFKKSQVVAGSWQYFQSGHYRVGIIMHLVTVLPASLLVPWQFLPVIRHKLLLFHRLNGYLLLLLLCFINASGLMIARRSLGGDVSEQIYVGLLVIWTTVGSAFAYINIKRQQIDQHRAWMLRVWILAGSIITLRLLQIMMAEILSDIRDYYVPMACSSIEYITSSVGPPGQAADFYAACRTNASTAAYAAVNVDYSGGEGVGGPVHVEEISAALQIGFGPAGIVAFFLHAVGVELYLHLTPAERDRLKAVSYERQLARGMRSPGNAGITVEQWGDANPWLPPSAAAAAAVEEGKVMGGERGAVSDSDGEGSGASSVEKDVADLV